MADIPAIVQRLRSGRRAAQLQAALRLAELAYTSSQAIAAAGGMRALVNVASSSSSSGNHDLLRAALAALAAITARTGLPDAFVAAGGMRPLAACLASCDSEDVLTTAAALAGHVMAGAGRAVCCAHQVDPCSRCQPPARPAHLRCPRLRRHSRPAPLRRLRHGTLLQ